MRTHTFTCIVCPLSCEMELVEEDDKILEVKGNHCNLGKKYAVDEFTNPVRTLTTTVRVVDGALPVLPVRSDEPVPKRLMKEIVEALNAVEVKAPIRCGNIVCENVFDTGINIVASRDLSERPP